jgi:hypothetical protein
VRSIALCLLVSAQGNSGAVCHAITFLLFPADAARRKLQMKPRLQQPSGNDVQHNRCYQ